MTPQVAALREQMAALMDLRNAARLLEWDQQTMMPPRGGQGRADTIATLARVTHEMFVSEQTATLIEAAAAELDGAPPESDDASLVRVLRRRWEKSRRVPSQLTADIARASSLAQEAWIAARERSDFAGFAPFLGRNLELARAYVDCFDGVDCAYDVLLDDFEPGMKTAEVAALFSELRRELVPLIRAAADRTALADDACLHGHFPIERQRDLVGAVVRQMGFEPEGWRLDEAVHPFATSLGAADVRITTRWDETFFPAALYGGMHECGHGLYDAGISPLLQRTPLGMIDSLGLHESQSRLWENMVGRGERFCQWLAPRVRQAFPDALSDLDPRTLFRALNRVEPSYIRVEADEVTYGLHIVLRFELEQELIEGRLAVADLPQAWNARFREYFGLEVPDDANGVLQDVHWSAGFIGYFPTYALGNLIAGQLWARAHVDLPDLDDQLAAGELAPLREWLRAHVHRHGSKFSARELLQLELGEPIQVGPFIAYLRAKLEDVYRR